MTWKKVSQAKSLISSWKKEPRPLKWSLTSHHPLWRRPAQLPTLLAGRSPSGQRMPSLPCELLCGLLRGWQVMLAPCGHWALATLPAPHPWPVHLCLHGNTCVCSPSQDQLSPPSFSGWWDSRTAATCPAVPLPRLPWPCVLPGRAVAQPSQSSPSTLLLSRPPEASPPSTTHRERGQALACHACPQYVPPLPG